MSRDVRRSREEVPDDLAKVSRTRVFFGHQSVGMNVLDGVAGVYAARGMAAPASEQDEQILGDYGALRRPDTDPELEAVRAAIWPFWSTAGSGSARPGTGQSELGSG